MRGRLIGILGGAFDPIHYGHIHIANEGLRMGLDEVLLVPSYAPPHREIVAPYEARIEWLEKAVGTECSPSVRPYFIEHVLPKPTYTYRLLMHAALVYPDDKLYLILGKDEMDSFYTWARPELIREIADLIPMPRLPGAISSTEIRELVQRGASVSHLTPIPDEELKKVYGRS